MVGITYGARWEHIQIHGIKTKWLSFERQIVRLTPQFPSMNSFLLS